MIDGWYVDDATDGADDDRAHAPLTLAACQDDDIMTRCSDVVWTCPADALLRKNARMRRDTHDDTLTIGQRKKRVQTVINDGLFADDFILLLGAGLLRPRILVDQSVARV